MESCCYLHAVSFDLPVPNACRLHLTERFKKRISFGWAAGDVSLAAYIQASLARMESRTNNVSALGAVMAFLYSTYIVIYAITSPLLGRYIDNVSKRNGGNISEAFRNIAGVQFTIISVLILVATFIPKGALSFNPNTLYGERLDKELDAESSEDGDEDQKQFELERENASRVHTYPKESAT